MANKIYYLDSRWLGIGGVRTIAGGFLAVMKKAIEGFNLLTPTSINISGGVMTIVYATDVNYTAGQSILMKGATEVALNKVYKVLTRNNTTITVATDQPDGPVTVGAIKTSYEPIPWSIVSHNTSSNKMLIKPKVAAPETRFFVQFDDNQVQYFNVRMYANATGILEGENDGLPVPLESQNAGGLLWGKSILTTDTDTTSKPWMMFTDGETLHWFWVHNNTTNNVYQQYTVGAYDNDVKGDTMRAVVFGATNASNLVSASAENGMLGRTRSSLSDTSTIYLLRDKMRVTPTAATAIWDMNLSGTPSNNMIGGTGTYAKYPASYFRSLSLKSLLIYKTDEPVGRLPGVFGCASTLMGGFTEPTPIRGDNLLNNRDILAIPIGYSGGTLTGSYSGVIFIDITGPWK